MDRTLLFLLALTAGCWSVEFDRADDWANEHDTSTTGTSVDVVPTGAGGEADASTTDGWTTGGVHTVTGVEPGSSSTDPEPEPPTIPLLVVDPTELDAVGPMTIVAKATNAEHMRIELDGELLAEADTSEVEVLWEALSSDDNGDQRAVRATAVGPGGETTRDAFVDVKVPPGGQTIWFYEEASSNLRFPERVAVDGDLTCIVGSQLQDKLRMELTCLSGDKLLWSRTIDQWTKMPEAADQSSLGTAIDISPSGEILVSGNLPDQDEGRSYWARVGPDGTLISERVGNLGDAAFAIAGGPDGLVALGGSEATPTGTSLRWWSFGADDIPIGGGSVPTKFAFAVDRVWAIDVDEAGDVWVAGETGVPDKVVQNKNSPRAFLGHWTLYGAPGGTWEATDDGEPTLALDVAATVEGPCISGVMFPSGPGFVRCFDSDLTLTGTRMLAGEAIEARGIARNRRGDAVVGGTTATGQGIVLALDRSAVNGAARWTSLYQEPELAITTRDVDCDAWGYCALLVRRLDKANMNSTAILRLTP